MGCIPSAERLGQMRVLLQGIGSCGKSTFAKQMRIIHNATFTVEEKQLFRAALLSNVVLGMRQLIAIAEEDGDVAIAKKTRSIIDDVDPYSGQVNQDVVDAVKILWENESIIQVKDELYRTEYAESLLYAMEKIDDICKADWLPDDEDILRARVRTTGIHETKFVTQSYEWTPVLVNFIVIDVGGQAQERRKWVSVQQGLTAMLYFVASDEYDFVSDEVEDLTKLDVSLNVWEECIHGPAISGTLAIILFLNKADLLESRIKRDGGKSFKKATGCSTAPKNLEAASAHLKQMFYSKIHEGSQTTQNQIYTHNTCALDTEQMRVVFDSVKDFVVQQRMLSMGLMRGM